MPQKPRHRDRSLALLQRLDTRSWLHKHRAMPKRDRGPKVTTLVKRALRLYNLWQPGQRVLCACSGGGDSTALLELLARLAPKLNFELLACGVDHGLREEATQELDIAENVAKEHLVPFQRLSVKLEPGGNLQARARMARHQALLEHARDQGAHVIALGHTADDRAETLLIRMVRGAGPSGLAVMPARAPNPCGGEIPIVRPLLLTRRKAILKYLQHRRLPHADDPSNQDPRFLRSRIRHEVMPLLTELNGSVVTHLCDLARMLEPYRDSGRTPLGKAQRLAIEQALQQRQPATVWLSDNIELRLDFCRNEAVRKPKA